jgi:H+-transporting ATPase
LVLNAVDRDLLKNIELLEHVPFDPVVKRTEGTVKDRETGKTFKCTKGAPHVLLKLVNDHDVEHMVENDVMRLGQRGIRCLAVAMTVDEDDSSNSNKKSNKSNKATEEGEDKWVFLGLLTFLDPPRPDTKQTIHEARQYGVAVKMITGDHLLIAKETARQLKLGDDISTAEGLPLLDPVTKQKPANLAKDYGDLCLKADGFAQVFPEHKYLIVECLRELGHKVGMTGDGVNDAPALKRADVGIAVSGATDAARAAADIVLTEPGLSTIIHGIVTSREIFARIRNFITYRIAATLQLLVFFFVAVFAFHPKEYEPATFDDDGETNWPECKYRHAYLC